MGTIHDLLGWGNADFRETHLGKNYLVANSEQRSATKFATRSVAEGECIASDERQNAVGSGKFERNPKAVFDGDQSGPFEFCVLRT